MEMWFDGFAKFELKFIESPTNAFMELKAAIHIGLLSGSFRFYFNRISGSTSKQTQQTWTQKKRQKRTNETGISHVCGIYTTTSCEINMIPFLYLNV